jgi:hypothetical protein
MLQLRQLAGGRLDEDALSLAMARHVLGGPRDDGRSSYQVSLSVCGACGGGAQRAGGELVPVETAVIEMAACDAQHITGLRAANENASLDAGTTAGAEGGAHDATAVPNGDERLATRLSSDHAHVGAQSPRVSDATRATASLATAAPPSVRTARADAPSSPRAKQSSPPALRRAVLTRDRHRCRVPCCTSCDVRRRAPRSAALRRRSTKRPIS